MLYLDNNATTKVDRTVIRDIDTALLKFNGNPSSAHSEGNAAKQVLEDSRAKVADFINADPEEIIFTGSATEANNLAIRGYFEKQCRIGFVCSAIEHPSVYNFAIADLPEMYDRPSWVGFADVDFFGRVRPESLEVLLSNGDLREKPLVSIMLANNEIGTVQDIPALAEIVHRYNGVFHTDATQAIGQIPIDVKELGVDMMTVGLHKCGLPKGIGFLYVRKGISLKPQIIGGHQEHGLRAGTENIPYIYAAGKHLAFLKAGRELAKQMTPDKDPYAVLNYLLIKLRVDIYPLAPFYVNGPIDFDKNHMTRLPHNLSLSFPGFSSDHIVSMLNEKGICVSSGSACCSGEKEISRVIRAINPDATDCVIRIGLSDYTKYDDCDFFVQQLRKVLISLQ